MTRKTLLASMILLASLSGCGDFRQALGLDRQAPDEYTVVEHAPLTMPPDFALRPPRDASERVAEAAPVQEARQTIFRLPSGQTPASVNGMSPGQNAFLSHAGAAGADSGIRGTVDQESASAQQPSSTFLDSLLFWKGAPQAADDSIDAGKEAQRLKNVEATGAAPAPDAPAASN